MNGYMRYGAVVLYGGPNGLIQTDPNGHGPSFVPMQPNAPLFMTDLAFNSATFSSSSMGQIIPARAT